MYRGRRTVTQNPVVLGERIAKKESELAQLQDECAELEADLQELAQSAMPVDADAIVKKHIRTLKEYNELRDTAMGLMRMIADQREMRLEDVMEEVGVEYGA